MGASPVGRTIFHRTEEFVKFSCFFSVLVGCLVLLGWTLDIEVFKRILPTRVAMNPVSAVSFVLLSISIRLSLTGAARVGPSPFARLLAGLIVLIASLKLGGMLLGGGGRVDQLLFTAKLAIDPTGQPNRMAPNAALNFLLLGCSLLFLDRRLGARFYVSESFVVIAIFNSLIPLIGYLYGTRQLYGIGSFIPMAPHSAALFLILGVGILFARPGRGLTATILDEGISGVMVRRLLPAVVLLPILLGWLRLGGQRSNLFDQELGMALMVVALILLSSAFVWWNSFLLLRLDARRRQVEVRLHELTLTDDLTGLRNRRGFYLLAEQELKRAAGGRLGIVLWCLYADLDGLKQINDGLGHEFGSQAIAQAAEILKATFRDSDIIGRLGGDEFAVLALGNSPDGGINFMERLQENVSAFNVRERPPYRLSLSLGLVRVDPGRKRTVDDLLEEADKCMYDNKRSKKGPVPGTKEDGGSTAP